VSERRRSGRASPERTKEYVEQLTSGDRLRVRITTQRGRVVTLTVNYECFVGGEWRAAYRADMAHGELHRHTRPWDPATDRQVPMILPDLATGLTEIITTLKRDWRAHRARLETSRQEHVHDEAG
jgi:hypothetical protein